MIWGKKSEKKAKKKDDAKLVIYFASDLHGSTVCFKKFINAAKFYGCNALFLGGDMTGKAILPIAEQPDGSYLADHAGETLRLRKPDEVDAYIKRASNMGFYPSVMTEAEFQSLKNERAAQHELFKKLVLDRVKEWCDFAEQKLQGSGIPLITLPGNDDFLEIDDVLREHPAIQFYEQEITELNGFEILYVGGSNPTPWNTEREYSEDEYRERFERLVPQVKDLKKCIFNVHVPPYDTLLDLCPKLDENLQVVYEMGNPVQMHAGSTAVREAIERYQPMLGLHGHIHEGRGNIKIGETVCINPGSVYTEGILQGAQIALDSDGIRDVQMLQG